MRRFTAEELASYDGRDGRPAYVVYDGKVYDVTDSFLWKGGRHQAMHDAGLDLTRALLDAPHGPDLLARCPRVGVLEEPEADRT
jgi:predicted heme/steroid binding protein